jgi:hypothetical protein
MEATAIEAVTRSDLQRVRSLIMFTTIGTLGEKNELFCSN